MKPIKVMKFKLLLRGYISLQTKKKRIKIDPSLLLENSQVNLPFINLWPEAFKLSEKFRIIKKFLNPKNIRECNLITLFNRNIWLFSYYSYSIANKILPINVQEGRTIFPISFRPNKKVRYPRFLIEWLF